jgi:hypothetical protein
MVDNLNPARANGGRGTFPAGAGRVPDAVTEAQLAEIGRLKALGTRSLDAFEAMLARTNARDDIKLVIRRQGGLVSEYVRLLRAFRQAIILERELMGLRPPRVVRQPKPRRRASGDDAENDLHERPDTATERDRADPRDDWDPLDYRPVGEAIDWIRRAVGAKPPEPDPCAPPDTGPAPEPEPPPQPAAAAKPAGKTRKGAPMGRRMAELRARLFRTTHLSPPRRMAPPPGIVRPAPLLRQPPRGPP